MSRFLLTLQQNPWLAMALKIFLFFVIAWIISRASAWLIRPLSAIFKLRPGRSRRPERSETLKSLLASGIGMLAYVAAGIASVGLFVSTDTLVWIIGLFSAAFGLAARPLISDIMTGVGFIFEDTFAVGEKVELLGMEGVVEAINLRTSLLRSPSGELYVIPNGEIRTIRNFSRGRFSTTNVHLKISSTDLAKALSLLEDLGKEAVVILPNMLDSWQVISGEGVLGQQTELTILAKARFGQAAEMRPKLLALIHERLAEAGIQPVD
jgi:small conductance mechanosensitive channel